MNIRTAYTQEQIVSVYGSNCYLCQQPIDFEASSKVGVEGWEFSYHPDHVIPLSKGGLDVMENLRPSHGQCNIRKAATLLEQAK
jgi:5-methylcytosine-specific restriction endonuclease McrA